MLPMTPLQSWCFIVMAAFLMFIILRLVIEIDLRRDREVLDDLDEFDIDTSPDQLYDWAEQGDWPVADRSTPSSLDHGAESQR